MYVSLSKVLPTTASKKRLSYTVWHPELPRIRRVVYMYNYYVEEINLVRVI